MLQVRRDLDLRQEPLDAEYRAQLWFQEFQRDPPVVLDVACEVHGGHATGADFAIYRVAVGERTAKAGDFGTHALRYG